MRNPITIYCVLWNGINVHFIWHAILLNQRKIAQGKPNPASPSERLTSTIAKVDSGYATKKIIAQGVDG